MATPLPTTRKPAQPYDAVGGAIGGMLNTMGAPANKADGSPAPYMPGVVNDTGIPAPSIPGPGSGSIPDAPRNEGPMIPGPTPPDLGAIKNPPVNQGPIRTPDPNTPVTPLPKVVQPGQGPGSPQNPGPIEPRPSPNLDPNVAQNQLLAAFQQQHGRSMTPQEIAGLQQLLGYAPGVPVTQAMLDQGLAYIKQYSGDPANPGVTPETPIPGYTPPDPNAPRTGTPPTPPPGTPGSPTPPLPPGQIDPGQAQTQLLSAFKAKFGREMTAQEIAGLQQLLGYAPGTPVTQEMLDKGLAYIAQYSGDPNNPGIGGPSTPVPGPNTPLPGTPGAPPPKTEAELLAEQRLAELLGQSWGEVDPNSPAMRAQRDAFELSAQRGTARKRASMAERAASRGAINSGGFDVGVEQLLDDEASARTAMEGGLMEKELNGQRQRLMQGIEMAKQFGLQEKAQALQEELAKLDLQLKEYLGKGNLGIGLLQQILGNQQFADSLGLDYAKLINLMNNQAIGAIL